MPKCNLHYWGYNLFDC